MNSLVFDGYHHPIESSELNALQCAQLEAAGLLFDGIVCDAEERLSAGEHELYRVEHWWVHDGSGRRLYSVFLFEIEFGYVFSATTTEVVARIDYHHLKGERAVLDALKLGLRAAALPIGCQLKLVVT